ncbi:rCG53868 [Rattus norvegicus]|uniref:RCG53868 n=1 Tax=Rattus norvegicus TaxID=10116 RepID=A6JAD3_RAT|nr:rCG53868 [Rattus norvegicus]
MEPTKKVYKLSGTRKLQQTATTESQHNISECLSAMSTSEWPISNSSVKWDRDLSSQCPGMSLFAKQVALRTHLLVGTWIMVYTEAGEHAGHGTFLTSSCVTFQ